MSAYHLLCRVLMHKTQQKTALFLCSFIVDSYFVGYVVWIAVVSSRVYIQYFIAYSSLLTVRKYISHWNFSHRLFLLSTLLSMHQFRQVSRGPHLWQISFRAVGENTIFVRIAAQVKTFLILLD